jgi:hypothetical protein
MTDNGQNPVPTPVLRVVAVGSLYPHEEHDSQRSEPLMERIRTETTMINPPLVAPMSVPMGDAPTNGEQYVILDGANRVHAFSALGYPHILTQVASYDSGLVELSTWQHVVAAWNDADFIQHLENMPDIALGSGEDAQAIAHIRFRDERRVAVCTPETSIHGRNAALRRVVAAYQRNARLHRTALSDPDEIWHMFPDAIALIVFPHYHPQDIIAAAHERAYLPPGISRHIVHGRAVRVNYPLDVLRDTTASLEQKNADLLAWLQTKLANRQVRYYAEATYQFDE